MGLVTNVLAFVVAIGVLVTVHEFGHFWVARRVGVKVLRFSIGFGRPLWSRTARDGTEYVIAAIPLGGYVKMLDEREGDVPDGELQSAFNRKPLWARNAVVAAGPVFNFIFAVFAFWLIFVVGTTEARPVLGGVVAGSPAAEAGFQRGDELLKVGGESTDTWERAAIAFIDQGTDEGTLAVVVRTADGVQKTRHLDMGTVGLLGDDPDVFRAIGFKSWIEGLEPVVGRVMPNSAASDAGLEAGSELTAAGGEPLKTWQDLVDYVRDRPGETVTFRVRQGGTSREVPVTIGSRDTDDGAVGVLGVSPEIPDSLFREIRYGPLAAVPHSVGMTWEMSALTVKLIGKMIVGDASVKNLSGPVNIAQQAGMSASLGLAPFLRFLAIVSISLGVLNLLPVPVLDGGHLLYNGIEWVRGRPLSEYAQGVGQQIGIALLVMLMAVAFYNDLIRLFGPR